MRGPVFEFMLDYGDEIRQGLEDNKIEYMGLAALSFSVTDMVELIHTVNQYLIFRRRPGPHMCRASPRHPHRRQSHHDEASACFLAARYSPDRISVI